VHPRCNSRRNPRKFFDEGADLYLYGSVVVVSFGGHTLGSVGIFVNLSPTRRFFYVRDSVDDEPGFENRVGKALLLRDSDDRPALADRIVRRLSQLHEMASVGSATACWRFS